jgi:hypothetical protein
MTTSDGEIGSCLDLLEELQQNFGGMLQIRIDYAENFPPSQLPTPYHCQVESFFPLPAHNA